MLQCMLVPTLSPASLLASKPGPPILTPLVCTAAPQLLMVMEYCEAGALVGPGTLTPERHLPEAMAQYYFRQIAAGLAYLHENHVVRSFCKQRWCATCSCALPSALLGWTRLLSFLPTSCLPCPCPVSLSHPDRQTPSTSAPHISIIPSHQVHGDMKPENVMLSGNGTVKIGDFGQSQFFGRRDVFNRTLGTPAYLGV